MRIRFRHASTAAGAAAVAVSAVLVFMPGAGAAIAGSTLVNPKSGKCLTVSGGGSANGTQVVIWTCGAAGQAWTSTAAGELRVTVAGATRCLAASGAGTGNGTRLVIGTCNGTANQKWNLNSTGTITGVPSGNNNQRWTPGAGNPSPSPSQTRPPSPTTSPPGTTCAVKSRPSGKVLQGYWENWDGASNGVHPPLGWIPITDSRIRGHGYNVINAAFPVIRSDGTVLWQDGMDATVKIPTPAEMCQAKAAGATILMSIGGAAAGIDLSSSSVADRFVATVVPILKQYNFDGIDIDIETRLTGSGTITQVSTSQANLIRIIDGVLAKMPANFGLTMAPETAYVTGGSVTYGSIWGAYLPIIKRYLDNGRLWWLNMQYY